MLQLFKGNDVIDLAIPFQLSHILQSFDVSVFRSFKCHLKMCFQRVSWEHKVLLDFYVSVVICDAYQSSFKSSNAISGFFRTGIWNSKARSICPDVLEQYFFLQKNTGGEKLSVRNVVRL